MNNIVGSKNFNTQQYIPKKTSEKLIFNIFILSLVVKTKLFIAIIH